MIRDTGYKIDGGSLYSNSYVLVLCPGFCDDVRANNVSRKVYVFVNTFLTLDYTIHTQVIPQLLYYYILLYIHVGSQDSKVFVIFRKISAIFGTKPDRS